MISILHLDKFDNEVFDVTRLNSVYVYALQKLDQCLEFNQDMCGNDHRFEWSIKETEKGFYLTMKDV